jgi:hypothetical protein
LHSLSKTFGLELIESVLTNHFTIFKTVSARTLICYHCTNIPAKPIELLHM